jgi:hypothetical protein
MSGSTFESMMEAGSLSPDVDWQAGVLPGTTQNADPSAAAVAGSFGAVAGSGTGRYGLLPLATGGTGTVGTAINDVWQWLNAPIKQPLAPASLALIVGIIIVAVIAWNLILYHIRIAAETI